MCLVEQHQRTTCHFGSSPAFNVLEITVAVSTAHTCTVKVKRPVKRRLFETHEYYSCSLLCRSVRSRLYQGYLSTAVQQTFHCPTRPGGRSSSKPSSRAARGLHGPIFRQIQSPGLWLGVPKIHRQRSGGPDGGWLIIQL